ncbi:MAG TPA: GntR family transcriptional regulator [Gemmataceae bacterium]|jgi:GntR family transcriptional regulator|nr:GntR family transcriptional regulator [Gemmataceae bacterium]
MLLDIRSDSSIPIYEQIVSQMIFSIASGADEPGELVLSVRDLAFQLRVHPNTVARAYQELERDGILIARRGKGMEVTAEAPAICKAKRQDIVRNRIREALREAVNSALQPDEVEKLVKEELHRVNGHRK